MPREDKNKRRYSDAKKCAAEYDSGFKPVTFKVPKGMEVFRFDREGNFKINVVPFIVAKNNPKCDEGLLHYERTYFTHPIGPNSNHHTCLATNCGKEVRRCPVCEDYFKLRREGADQDTLKELKPKTRQLFLFDVLAQPEKKVQLYESSYYFGFGQLLNDKLDAADEDSPYLNFFHAQGGMTLVVTAKQTKYPGGTRIAPTNIEMIPRVKTCKGPGADYTDEFIEEQPSLDDLIILEPYDDMKKIYLQLSDDVKADDDDDATPAAPAAKKKAAPAPVADDDDDDDDGGPAAVAPPPAKKKAAPPPPPPDDDDDDAAADPTAEQCGLAVGARVKHATHGKCDLVHVSGDGTSIRLKDAEGVVHKGIAPKDVTKLKPKAAPPPPSDDDDDDAPPPPPAKKAKAAPPPPPADDDDDDAPTPAADDDDDDDGGPAAAAASADDDDDDGPAATPPPAKKKAAAKPAPAAAADDDDDDDGGPAVAPAKKKAAPPPPPPDDDDDDDAPPPPPAKKKKAGG